MLLLGFKQQSLCHKAVLLYMAAVLCALEQADWYRLYWYWVIGSSHLQNTSQ